jgi:hypothetical protein
MMEIVLLVFILLSVPAAVIGYVATKQLKQTSAGIFWGMVAFMLSGSIGLLFDHVLHRPLVFGAGGEILNPHNDFNDFAVMLIAIGLSSVIVMTILTLLPKTSDFKG